jgi:hypothetical protein
VSGCPVLAEGGRRFGVVVLLTALLFPGLILGLAEPVTTCVPGEAALVAPPGPSETQGEPERSAAPLLVLLQAALASFAADVPEPLFERLLTQEADRLSGSAVIAFVPPPPRRA